MSADLLILPVWKKDSTAEEWFYDMAMLARKNPERFHRMVLIYEEMSPDGASSRNSYYCHGVSTTEAFGLIEIGKQKLYEKTHHR